MQGHSRENKKIVSISFGNKKLYPITWFQVGIWFSVNIAFNVGIYTLADTCREITRGQNFVNATLDTNSNCFGFMHYFNNLLKILSYPLSKRLNYTKYLIKKILYLL